VNQYVEYQHEFILVEKLVDAEIFVSVDTNYAMWLNGSFVDSGQYHDYPNHKIYDRLPVSRFLKPGKNVLRIMAYYQGENSAQYRNVLPGMIYSLEAEETVIVSGADTKYRLYSCYRNGPMARINDSLGFTFEYDARRKDELDWQQIGQMDIYEDRSWELFPRPIRKLLWGDRVPVRLLNQGFFKRMDHSAESTVAHMMQTDFLSYRKENEIVQHIPEESSNKIGLKVKTADISSDGVYLIFDLGREETGHLELEVQADAGIVIDAAYGEHLDDLRVRAEVDGRNFGSRYICKEGRQVFTHYFTRWAGRYLELHISRIKNQCIFYYAGLRRVEYQRPIWKMGFQQDRRRLGFHALPRSDKLLGNTQRG
jgi:hypothetical protein